MENRAGAQVIEARVPLRHMFGYATRGALDDSGPRYYTMQFGAYEPCAAKYF